MLLITGSKGFLGNVIVSKLKEADFKDILTPTSTELDLTNESSVLTYFERNRPDSILHLAAKVGGIGENLANPAGLIQSNNKMTVNLFEAIERYNINTLYACGTICAYPKYCQVPFKEDDLWNGLPDLSNNSYSQSKRILLSTQQAYKTQYNMKGVHFLIVNLFGPNDNFDLKTSHVISALINKFIYAIDNNKQIVECWGTGEASREFLYVEDAAEAISQTIINKIDYFDPINIGTGKSILIKNLATMIGRLTGFTGDIIFNGEVGDGQPKRQLNVSRAKEILGFEAKTDLEAGLIKTIEWYQHNKGLV